ncbi:MAG: carbohydrate kinase family protein, partial [Ginsengibacter sp.]
MNKKKILVVGELNIDIILDDINGIPVIGHEILADKMNITLGSSSAIFASNIATLGVDTSFCGIV